MEGAVQEQVDTGREMYMALEVQDALTLQPCYQTGPCDRDQHMTQLHRSVADGRRLHFHHGWIPDDDVEIEKDIEERLKGAAKLLQF